MKTTAAFAAVVALSKVVTAAAGNVVSLKQINNRLDSLKTIRVTEGIVTKDCYDFFKHFNGLYFQKFCGIDI